MSQDFVHIFPPTMCNATPKIASHFRWAKVHARCQRAGEQFFVSGARYFLEETNVYKRLAVKAKNPLRQCFRFASADGPFYVTICTSAKPSARSAALISLLSSNGRSGTMKPSTPAAAASRASAGMPYASKGFR